METHAWNPSTRDVEAGESAVQGYRQGQSRQQETIFNF